VRASAPIRWTALSSRTASLREAYRDPKFGQTFDGPWSHTMLRSAFVLLAALCIALAPATAQVKRSFPADALRGALVVQNVPEVTLNGAPARLAPGARIRGPNNMLAMSGAIAGQRLLVNYTLDMQGQLKDVWILTPEEAAKRPWPATPQEAAQWTFDAAAQTWTRK
jgi:hypothetical protein